MKKFFLVLMVLMPFICLISCSNSETIDIVGETVGVDYYKVLSKDSLTYYYVEGDRLIKCMRDGDNMVWECNLHEPDPTTVDFGYGISYIVNNYQCIPLVDTERFVIVYWRSYGYDFSYDRLQVYSMDGEMINDIKFVDNEKFVSCGGYTRWVEGSLIIPFGGGVTNGYIVIDNEGNLLEKKEGIDIRAINSPLYTWERGFASILGDKFYECDLDNGTKLCYIENVIGEMYPNEKNLPQIKEVNSIERREDGFRISCSLLFWDGHVEKVDINIFDDMMI